MDPIFLILFGAGFLITLFIEIRTSKSLKRNSKFILFAVNGITTVLVGAAALGIYIPMPTQFFHNFVSPWIRVWLES